MAPLGTHLNHIYTTPVDLMSLLLFSIARVHKREPQHPSTVFRQLRPDVVVTNSSVTVLRIVLAHLWAYITLKSTVSLHFVKKLFKIRFCFGNWCYNSSKCSPCTDSVLFAYSTLRCVWNTIIETSPNKSCDLYQFPSILLKAWIIDCKDSKPHYVMLSATMSHWVIMYQRWLPLLRLYSSEMHFPSSPIIILMQFLLVLHVDSINKDVQWLCKKPFYGLMDYKHQTQADFG